MGERASVPVHVDHYELAGAAQHGLAGRSNALIEAARARGIDDGLLGGKPHPRTYGAYPRLLGTYVREEKVLSLPEAVRKMTSLPARAMGFERKGLVREGMDADLVVFDPGTVGSPASYDEPRQFPRGIDHVIVGGEFAVRDGETTGATPGAAIRIEN